jgi:hypothetical protein
MNDEIRTKAADCAAWAKQRAEILAESGAAVPEPIRRLLDLSEAVVRWQSAPMVSITSPPPSECQKCMVLAADLAESREATSKAHHEAARALRESASVLLGVASMFGATPEMVPIGATLAVRADGAIAPVARPTLALRANAVYRHRTEDVRVRVVEHLGQWTAHTIGADGAVGQGRATSPEVWFADEWTEETPEPLVTQPAKLAHNKVLRHIDGRRVLISEPKRGEFVASFVGNGDVLGPPVPVEPGGSGFPSPHWIEVGSIAAKGPAKWDAQPAPASNGAAASDRQIAIPGSGPAPGVLGAPPVATAADWNPDDVFIASSVKSLGEAMAKTACPVEVTPELVRSFVVKFKAEKGSTPMQSPGRSFFHWAKKSLTG